MKLCTAQGCTKPAKSKDLCRTHYYRLWKTGSLEVQRTEYGEPLKFLRSALKHKDKKKCLIWPYAKLRGYARVRYRGRDALVCRIICAKIYGKSPSRKHHSCHSCGKGHTGCINPHHLYWGTPKENSDDKIKHGTNGLVR